MLRNFIVLNVIVFLVFVSCKPKSSLNQSQLKSAVNQNDFSLLLPKDHCIKFTPKVQSEAPMIPSFSCAEAIQTKSKLDSSEACFVAINTEIKGRNLSRATTNESPAQHVLFEQLISYIPENTNTGTSEDKKFSFQGVLGTADKYIFGPFTDLINGFSLKDFVGSDKLREAYIIIDPIDNQGSSDDSGTAGSDDEQLETNDATQSKNEQPLIATCDADLLTNNLKTHYAWIWYPSLPSRPVFGDQVAQTNNKPAWDIPILSWIYEKVKSRWLALTQVTSGVVGDLFGHWRTRSDGSKRQHRGIDIAAPLNTPVNAACDGTIISAGWNNGGFGNLLAIKHPKGTCNNQQTVVTLYAHLQSFVVKKGNVKAGQHVGRMGSTGFSTGSHLHLECHVGAMYGKRVDPIGNCISGINKLAQIVPGKFVAYLGEDGSDSEISNNAKQYLAAIGLGFDGNNQLARISGSTDSLALSYKGVNSEGGAGKASDFGVDRYGIVKFTVDNEECHPGYDDSNGNPEKCSDQQKPQNQ